MTIEEAMSVVERGSLASTYVLAGPNRFWRREWLVRATKRWLGEDVQSTATIHLDGVSDFNAVKMELATAGLFSPRRLVVVEGGRWPKKEETLAEYLRHPIADSLLVLIEEKAASWEKALGGKHVVDMSVLPPHSFRRFVKEQAQHRGITWQKGAFERFCEQVDGNEFVAIEELEKLALGTPAPISNQDLDDLVVPIVAEDKPWDVTDSLLRHDGKAVMEGINRHLNQGMAPLFLFALLTRQLIQIDRARGALREGMTLAQFQQQEGLRDFVAKKIWAAAKQWTDDDLDVLLNWAAKIDVAMKTGYGEPDVWLIAWTHIWAEKKIPPGYQRGGRMHKI
ncbi:MAG: DNA polymerase III subunit delta [Sulfobacillus acidophilus]|uniref:DNA-directed DNA polymerase n=1 Tax=Sulfobacillus acidophilus TaxID=53633 RepID=A0A2T2WN53_9FIRM|nr:MAG: DNA polymerase III subunit delta [Sulfobacillus acidophilus]